MRLFITLVALVTLAAAACSDGAPTERPSSATPTSTSGTPTPSVEPEIINGITVKPLAVAAAIPLPDDLALYVESGCWGCDAPAAGLERVYRAPDGEVRTESLFRLPGATVQQPEVGGQYIMSIAPSRGGGDLLISVCEGPYCGGVGPQQAGAKSSIRHSVDGGITWANELTIEGGAYVVANFGAGPEGNGFGLLRIYRSGDETEAGKMQLAYYPTLATEPIELGSQTANEARILVPANGPPLLRGEDGVSFYRVEGGPGSAPWFRFESLPAGSTVEDLQFISNGLLITWTNSGTMYTAVADTNAPEIAPKLAEIFRWPDNAQPFFHRPQGGFSSDGSWVVAINGARGQLPSLVDFDAAAIRPFAELVQRSSEGDRLLVRAVGVGPFARVQGTGEGSCLNVREAASLSASPFACYRDGTLLREMGQRADAEGHHWTLVRTPADRQGWASTEFLETPGDSPSLAWHPAGTRTGDAEIDAVIAAVEQSAFVPQSLIGWQSVACRVPGAVQGLGGPPECPEGIADETPIDVIPAASCEGYWVQRPPGDEPVRLIVDREQRLYAVGKLDPAQQYPRGEHALIYVLPSRPEFGTAIYVTDGKIVAEWSGCATSPVEMLRDAASIVFPPPPPGG